jgi:hypothetical protein
MPTETHPTTIRLTAAQRADLDEIAAAWGGEVRPLSWQQTMTEMIRRSAAEVRARKAQANGRARADKAADL